MKKILVIRFSSLGDVVLTTPVYKNLKQFFPQSHITVALKDKYAGALENNPSIDQLLILKEGQSLFSFIREIRSQNFDILIDLHNNLRSRLISLISNIPVKIHYKKAFWARRLFVKTKHKNPELERHTIHRYLDALKPLGIQAQVFPPEWFPSSTSSPGLPLRILIVQTAFLGDAVLTTPLLRALSQNLPQAKVTILCTPEIQDVFIGNPYIHEILVMDKRGKDKGMFSVWRWAQKLRNQFDLALLPHRSFRSAFMICLAGIPKRIGFSTSQGRLFLTDLVSFDWGQHDVERNVKLLESLGIFNVQPKIDLPVISRAFNYEDFCSTYQIEKGTRLVGLNPGSVWKTKRWLPEHFARVADQLIQEFHCKILLFGSKKDEDALSQVEACMKQKPINLCGKTDLKTLSFLISRCALFVTNDSGPMHLAVAAQVPVVAIFGPTTRELGFFPYGEKSVVVELDLPCRPCTLHGGNRCPLGHFKCMRDIDPESVLVPCRKFLEANK